jgi:prepilin-type N-terminal cleavage/methylation domain-containing protein
MTLRLAPGHASGTRRRSLGADADSEAGFTLLEMLIATALIVVITGGVFQLLNPSYGTFQAQPEVSDMQQRLRVAADTLQKDFVMAGAGTYSGAMVGSLDNFFAPVLPHKVGTINPDAPGTFNANPLCPDTCAQAVTIMYVPATMAQTSLRTDMPTPSAELKVNQQAGCPIDDNHAALCGFEQGMRVLIFDPTGAYDIFTVTQVQDESIMLQHRDDKFTTAYDVGAWITAIESHTYYLNQNVATNTYELRHYDGYKTDLPVVDNVVDFRVEFFGDPSPPQLTIDQSGNTWTTYGPKPPPIGTAYTKSVWGAGENCVFYVDPNTGRQTTRPQIQTLGPTGSAPVLMDAGMLTDGPWCPSEKSIKGDDMPNRYDADLLRLRQVRLTLRVQVANALLRGPAGPLFRVGGRSTGGERFVPDQEIRFDVSPRNMNLGR